MYDRFLWSGAERASGPPTISRSGSQQAEPDPKSTFSERDRNRSSGAIRTFICGRRIRPDRILQSHAVVRPVEQCVDAHYCPGRVHKGRVELDSVHPGKAQPVKASESRRGARRVTDWSWPMSAGRKLFVE